MSAAASAGRAARAVLRPGQGRIGGRWLPWQQPRLCCKGHPGLHLQPPSLPTLMPDGCSRVGCRSLVAELKAGIEAAQEDAAEKRRLGDPRQSYEVTAKVRRCPARCTCSARSRSPRRAQLPHSKHAVAARQLIGCPRMLLAGC